MKFRLYLLSFCFVCILSACSSTSEPYQTDLQSSTKHLSDQQALPLYSHELLALQQLKDQSEPLKPKKPKLALALGGGAAKGFAHIGVIKVLEHHGIRPDIITGTSAGSIVGAMYASGMTVEQLIDYAVNLNERRIIDFAWSLKGPIKGARLEEHINDLLRHQTIEHFPITFAAVATEQETGQRVVFTQGLAGRAVRASSSVPNVFQPVLISGKHYIDGGLVSPVPVSTAKELGADVVIAVDISDRPSSDTRSLGALGTFEQSLYILRQAILDQELDRANIILRPAVIHYGSVNFKVKRESIAEGERSASDAIPAIQKILADHGILASPTSAQ